MAREVARIRKQLFGADHLIFATQCGVDQTRRQGLAANRALGVAVDTLVKLRGTAILAETAEWIGAEQLLTRRAINRQVADRIASVMRRYEIRLETFGEDFVGKQASPGNIEGG